MSYLLDTNVVSELRKPKPHGAVVQWIQDVSDAEVHISAVTIGEIQAGIELTREQDEPKAIELEQWLDLVSGSFNVIPMDAAAFAAGLKKWGLNPVEAQPQWLWRTVCRRFRGATDETAAQPRGSNNRKTPVVCAS